MKQKQLSLCLLIFLFATTVAFGTNYNMPTTGSVSYTANTGDYFYDSGGSAGSYSASENGTVTFNCGAGGQCLQFSFFLFNVQLGNDFLYVYDGPSTSYPLIGTFTRIGSPGTIVASLGSLTFKFTSTSSQQRVGWGASITTVTCAPSYDIKTNNGQTISVCSAVFYDSGLSAGSYGLNENYTTTFSSSSGNCIQGLLYAPSGTSFAAASIASGDTLKVYDGLNTSSPIIGKYSSGVKTPTRWLSSSGSLTFKFTSNNTTNGTGWIIGLSCTVCPAPLPSGTTYTQPAGANGFQNTACGANMVNTCTGTITDDGGLAGNYSGSIGLGWQFGLYRTFCPASAGNCLRIQFYEIKINGAAFSGKNDNLRLINGSTQYNLPLTNGNNIKGVSCISYDDCMGQGFGPYVSTDPSGCITVIFQSNADNVTDAGWKGTIDCVPCTYGPLSTDNTDCINATPICSNISLTDASTGPGLTSEGDVISSCVVAENFTNWYQFTIQTGGTLGFTIAPYKTGTLGDDYDFALYGPNTLCGSLGSPIRCSYAWSNVSTNTTNKTGMNSATNSSFNDGSVICGTNNSGSDVSEDVCGNSWVDELNVTAGQVYYLMINKWTANGDGFDLTWNLTNGASLQCIVLPIVLTSFTCEDGPGLIYLDWITASEINNDHFVIERSSDAENYSVLTTVPGKGTSSQPTEYFLADTHPLPGVNYYRLSQVDKDGHEAKLKVTSCTYADANEEVTLEVFDMSGALLFSKHIMSADFNQAMYDLPLNNGVYVTAMIHQNGQADLGKYLRARP